MWNPYSRAFSVSSGSSFEALLPSCSSPPSRSPRRCTHILKLHSAAEFCTHLHSWQTSPHLGKHCTARCLLLILYPFLAPMSLRFSPETVLRAVYSDGVFEVSWTDIFSILLQQSIWCLGCSWAPQECFICVLQHWEDNHDNKFTKLRTGGFCNPSCWNFVSKKVSIISSFQ